LSHNCTGTPALTSRGFVEEDFAKVADFFDAAVNLAVKIKAATTGIYIYFFFLKKSTAAVLIHLHVQRCPYVRTE
jgi:glycine/serine hydroxymethyltransferase